MPKFICFTNIVPWTPWSCTRLVWQRLHVQPLHWNRLRSTLWEQTLEALFRSKMSTSKAWQLQKMCWLHSDSKKPKKKGSIMVFQIVVLHSVLCMYLLFRLSTRQKGHSRNCRRHRSAKGQNGGLCYIFWPGGWKSVGLFSRNWHARFQNDALQIDSIVLGWDQLLRVTQVKQKKTRENARSQYFFRCVAR